MSILLDSLEQTNSKSQSSVPSVHDSHFDDDMLNDEALEASNRFWKLASLVLAVSLLMSFSYIYSQTSDRIRNPVASPITTSAISQVNTDKLKVNNQLNQNSNNVEKNSHDSSDVAEKNIQNISSIQNVSNNQKNNHYKPQKREIKKEVVNESNVSSIQKETEARVGAHVENNKDNNDNYEDMNTLDYEELSTDLLMELPSLEISSYAVSSNIKKSFIVLNNSFYGNGETVAPNLQLVSIEKQSVLFKYKNLFIRKKYK